MGSSSADPSRGKTFANPFRLDLYPGVAEVLDEAAGLVDPCVGFANPRIARVKNAENIFPRPNV